MFILAVPAMDQHEWTHKLVSSLKKTIEPGDFHLAIFDQASDEPYTKKEFGPVLFPFTIVRLEKNIGYYRVMAEVAKLGTSADIIGLVHNDVIFYEKGWNRRLSKVFINAPIPLGMIGLCGSWQLDSLGGRGSGTMVNFRGELQKQPQVPTYQVNGDYHLPKPALIYDSLFMAMRASLLPVLKIDEHTPLVHFMDRVWPLRLWEAGWKCGYIGIEIDHAGGISTIGSANYETACKVWCEQEQIPADRRYPFHQNLEARTWMTNGQYQTLMYMESEHRFLMEYKRKGKVPSWVSRNWDWEGGIPQSYDYAR